MEKLETARVTGLEIEKARDEYRPAAKRGAVLFFTLAELQAINSMYQYSLGSYMALFDLSLRRSMPSAALKKRLGFIIDALR